MSIKICKKVWYGNIFQKWQTLKNILVASKDKDTNKHESGVIYRYTCCRLDCNEEHAGVLARTFEKRYKENLMAPSPINDRQSKTGYSTPVEDVNIVGRERNKFARTIIESIYMSRQCMLFSTGISVNITCHIYWMELCLQHQNLK